MTEDKKAYIYALHFKALTAVYDLVIGATMREKRFKTELIRRSGIGENDAILDIGCGTATLSIMIQRMYPGATVHGLDGDPAILLKAGEKASREGVNLILAEAMSDSIPYPDAHFDHVFSSLMFHHLTTTQKIATLKEIYRILRKGGELHIADFGRPSNIFMRIIFSIIRVFDSIETTSDNARGLIPTRMETAGFQKVKTDASFDTVFGTVCLYSGSKI